MKLLESGSAERLRQNESCGKSPLVVAADTGLMSGEGVSPAMIGGSRNTTAEAGCKEGFWREQRRRQDIDTNVWGSKLGSRGKIDSCFQRAVRS